MNIVNGLYAAHGLSKGRPAFLKLNWDCNKLYNAYTCTAGANLCSNSAPYGDNRNDDIIRNCSAGSFLRSSSITESFSWTIGDSTGREYFISSADTPVPPNVLWTRGANGTDQLPTITVL